MDSRGHVSPQLGPSPVLLGSSMGSCGWAKIPLLNIVKRQMSPGRLEGLGPVGLADKPGLF